MSLDTSKLKLELSELIKENDESKLIHYDSKLKLVIADVDRRVDLMTRFKNELLELLEYSAKTKRAIIQNKQDLITGKQSGKNEMGKQSGKNEMGKQSGKNEMGKQENMLDTRKSLVRYIVISSNTEIQFTNKKYKINTIMQNNQYNYKIDLETIPRDQNINISDNIFHLNLNVENTYKLVVEYISESNFNMIQEGKIICKKR